MSSPEAAAPLDITHHFANLPDPRHPAFRGPHRLGDLLGIALTALLSGAHSWDAIAAFGLARETWLRSLGLPLPGGIPSHDTVNRLFAALHPRAFQDAFAAWINAVCNTLGFCHLPIDGKTARGARGPDGTGLHLVSAWAAQQRLSLAQVAVEGKSNESTALPQLLRLLDLHGALVSSDAIGCQKDIARQIGDGGGDYLLAVQDNQPTLYADVRACFEQSDDTDFAGGAHDTFTTTETSHGRYEERLDTVLYEPSGLSSQAEWVDLRAVVHVTRTRRQGDQQSDESAYYISSSPAAAVLAERVPGRAVRRGPLPDAAGPGGGEPGLAAPDGPGPVPAGRPQGQHPHPEVARRPR